MELTIALSAEHYCEVSVRQCLTSRRSRQTHINLVPMDSAQIMLLEKIPKEYTMCVCLHIHTCVHAYTHICIPGNGKKIIHSAHPLLTLIGSTL